MTPAVVVGSVASRTVGFGDTFSCVTLPFGVVLVMQSVLQAPTTGK